MSTKFIIWDQVEQRMAGGPFNVSGDCDAAIRRKGAKGKLKAEDAFSNVSVTCKP